MHTGIILAETHGGGLLPLRKDPGIRRIWAISGMFLGRSDRYEGSDASEGGEQRCQDFKNYLCIVRLRAS